MCICTSIISIHLKNLISEQISKSGFSSLDRILVGIQDFQAKSGWLDSLINFVISVWLKLGWFSLAMEPELDSQAKL